MERFYGYGRDHLKREQDVSKSNVNWNRRAAEFSLCCNRTDDSYMAFWKTMYKLEIRGF